LLSRTNKGYQSRVQIYKYRRSTSVSHYLQDPHGGWTDVLVLHRHDPAVSPPPTFCIKGYRTVWRIHRCPRQLLTRRGDGRVGQKSRRGKQVSDHDPRRWSHYAGGDTETWSLVTNMREWRGVRHRRN
ncbi:hypothetical protein BC937DRAFT_93546, partial [Endogone sp. FLAS-F59071]